MKSTLAITATIFIALFCFSAFTHAGPDGKCRILMSSGGGDRIFFEYGALNAFKFLYKDLKEIQYDVVTGISAGSLLSSMFSRFAIGDEARALKRMGDVLFSIQQRSDIIADWPGGWWEGLTQHSGIFDSTPLLQLINDHITSLPATDRQLRIGAIDQISGKMDIYHENSEHLNYGILGSCSVPGIFPSVPITMKNGSKKRYVDGGVKTNYLADSGIEACLSKGYKEENIIIDSLMCYSLGFTPKTVTDDIKTIESLMLGLDIGSFHNGVAKLQAAMTRYPKAVWRNIIQPDLSIGPLPSVGLNFIPAEMEYMYQRGLNDTRIQLEKFPNGNAKEMIDLFAKQTTDVDVGPL